MQRHRLERLPGPVFDERSIAAALVPVLTASCSSMGPRTIRTDQFNYNSAIAGSSNEQLLLNIVRLRYSETPVFLKVSSVINQYRRSAGISASAGHRTSVTGGDTVGGSGDLAWADSPTITYAPLSGKEFATNLLTPVPAWSLFKLVEAGWPPEHVFRIAVISINGLENEVTRPIGRRQADPRFRELLELWGRLRADRAVGMSERGEKGDPFLFFPEGEFGEQVRSDRARFRELLGMRRRRREAAPGHRAPPREAGSARRPDRLDLGRDGEHGVGLRRPAGARRAGKDRRELPGRAARASADPGEARSRATYGRPRRRVLARLLVLRRRSRQELEAWRSLSCSSC